MSILVDSSIWIAAASSKNPECLALKRLISKREPLFITRLIQVEVCQGARSAEVFHQLWNTFLGFPCLEVTDRIWGLSAWNYFNCRKNGVTPSTADCLIATIAQENRLSLWTKDKDFRKISKTIPIKFY